MNYSLRLRPHGKFAFDLDNGNSPPSQHLQTAEVPVHLPTVLAVDGHHEAHCAHHSVGPSAEIVALEAVLIVRRDGTALAADVLFGAVPRGHTTIHVGVHDLELLVKQDLGVEPPLQLTEEFSPRRREFPLVPLTRHGIEEPSHLPDDGVPDSAVLRGRHHRKPSLAQLRFQDSGNPPTGLLGHKDIFGGHYGRHHDSGDRP